MRKTLTIDDDIAERLAEIARESGRSFEAVVHDTLRRGLAENAPPLPQFEYTAHAGHMFPGIDDQRLNDLALGD